MPSEPEHAPASLPDAEQTAILDAVPGAPAPSGYGDRFAEDAFDYPLTAGHARLVRRCLVSYSRR
ncbi:hypothetical protein [Streptomyces avermitilis]|uniref:hypothetical protein n=1 Tax=Streptomyces avermitilis TaxID=33903 RepID=UPI00368C5EB5